MRQTLAEVVIATESERSDTSKEHLSPGGDRNHLAHNAMADDDVSSDLAVEAPLEVKLEVNAENDLEEDQPHQPRGESAVDTWGELPALVPVSEHVSENGHDGRNGLDWYVPSRACYLRGA